MVNAALAKARIESQGLAGDAAGVQVQTDPHLVASAFGASQGQDLSSVVASLGLRTGQGVESVLAAFEAGSIVRAYPMRGTVFLLAAEDVLWVSELCNSTAVRSARKRSPSLGLEDQHFAVAQDTLESLAQGGISRRRLFDAWGDHGVSPDSGRGYHLLKHFISTGIAHYGGWDGKENLLHLSEGKLPPGSTLEHRFNGDRTAAAAELMRRYFTTRGPATIDDMAWWSKLPKRLLNEAAAQLTDLEHGHVFDLEQVAYWHPEATHIGGHQSPRASEPQLLPPFDEVILGYRDRHYIVPEKHHEALVPGNNGIFRSAAVSGGQVVGYWRRTGNAPRRKFMLEPFGSQGKRALKKFETKFHKFPFLRP